jgi:hypothetical protein
VPWKLAVTTAADVLLVCRLDPRYREADFACFLIERGVPFHTLVWKNIMPNPPPKYAHYLSAPFLGPQLCFQQAQL